MGDILDRVRSVMERSKLSCRAFALRCRLTPQTLDNQLRGIRTLSLETVRAILTTYPDVSAEWMMRGKGEINKEDAVETETRRVAMLVDTIATLQETINEKSRTIALLAARLKQTENQ